ncbi:MAG: hypothetical protein U9Q62_06005 [Campylobacterota bacterium]|nr:hypothetical protein [Campylobacterota bacterium]
MKTLKDQNDRRLFLKKAAYVIPTVVGLGYLTQPTASNAMGRRGGGGGHATYVASNEATGSSFKRNCNNGWGNGDDCAPGNSLFNNNAENNNPFDGNPHNKHFPDLPGDIY